MFPSSNLGSVLYLVITHLPPDRGTSKDDVSTVRLCQHGMYCTMCGQSVHQILALTKTIFLKTLLSIKHAPEIIQNTRSNLPRVA